MTDHLDPCRHDVELLADVLADHLELGAILGAAAGIFGQLVDDLDARQLGRQGHATPALGGRAGLGSRLFCVCR